MHVTAFLTTLLTSDQHLNNEELFKHKQGPVPSSAPDAIENGTGMTVADLLSILKQHEPATIVVLSMFPGQSCRPMDVVAVEPTEVFAVRLTAVNCADDYRKRYAVGVTGDDAGVWLG